MRAHRPSVPSPAAVNLAGLPTVAAGYKRRMAPEPERVEERAAEILPEERRAGTSVPEEQAAAILADSERRQEEREGSGATVEHRRVGGTGPAVDLQ